MENLSIEARGSEFLLRPRVLTKDPYRARSDERYNIGGTIYYDCAPISYNRERWFQDLAECKFDKRMKTWRAPQTETIALAIQKAWGAEKITYSNSAASTVMHDLLATWDRGEAIATLAAGFKERNVDPPLPRGWAELKGLPLSPYQRASVALALKARGGFGLFLDRGTGKTACAVQFVNMLAIQLRNGDYLPSRGNKKFIRALIVVPKNVRLNWKREFEKFSHRPGKVSVLRGGPTARVGNLALAIADQPGIDFAALIVGYDQVKSTLDYLQYVPWDVIITDESHNYKSPNTGRWKAGILEMRDCADRRLSLTGSPIGNSPMDLYTQLEFLREGGSGFADYKTFREFHGVWKRTSGDSVGVKKLVGLKHIPFLQERLSRMTFSISKEEAGLQLPDKNYTTREVPMTAIQTQVYKEMETDLAVRIGDLDTGDEMSVSNTLTMLLRLAQITSGFVTYDAQYNDDGDVVTPKRIEEIDNNKKDEVLSLLRDDREKGAKTIIFCRFIPNILMLEKFLTEKGYKVVLYHGSMSDDARDASVDQFNRDPETTVFIGNPQTAGEGLNLLGYEPGGDESTFCDMVIFYSQGWSAIHRGQAEDRAHRRGTLHPVEIVDLICPDRIDEIIYDRVMSKIDMAQTVTNLKETLLKILND